MRRNVARDTAEMTSPDLAQPVQKVLASVLAIEALTVKDRAEVQRLIIEAGRAAELYAPVLNIPIGLGAYLERMKTLLTAAQRSW